MILNRCDLADPAVTKKWAAYFRAQGLAVLETDARSGRGVNAFPAAVRELLRDKLAEYERKGQSGRGLRIMVLGIPNVGKSTFINKVAGRKAAAAGDKPGVTRGRQWISIDRSLDLLDTPGILWPKFDSQEVGEMLAVTNAIKSDVLDRETLAANFMLRLCELYPDASARGRRTVLSCWSRQPNAAASSFPKGNMISSVWPIRSWTNTTAASSAA